MSIDAKAAAVPGISSAIQELCEAENRLTHAMQSLIARMEPVLVPTKPEASAELREKSDASPLAQAISNHAYTIRSMARDVEGLLSALDT